MILASIIMVEGGFASVMKKVVYYEGERFILNIPFALCQVAFVAGGLMLIVGWSKYMERKEKE